MASLKYFVLFTLMPILAFSQMNFCGTTLEYAEPETIHALQNFYQKEVNTAYRSQQMGPVGITFHLVQAEPESPDFRYDQLEALVDRANLAFSASDISFYICGSPRYVDGLPNYTYRNAERLNSIHHVPNTINIYLVDGIVPPGGGLLCGLAKFPFQTAPEDRYLLLARDCALAIAPFIHELGHFFGLLHTHETRFGYELVNGSNCLQTGDLICDTPADPKLNLPNSMYNCSYIGRWVDYNGDFYQPNVDNYMSYSPYLCQQNFTPRQRSIMEQVAAEENQYLSTHSCQIRTDLVLGGSVEQTGLSFFDPIQCDLSISGVQLTETEVDIHLRIMLYNNADRKVGTLLYEAFFSPAELQQGRNIRLALDLPDPVVSGTYYFVAELDANQQIIESTEANNFLVQKVQIENRAFDDIALFPNPALETAYFFLRSPATRGAYTMKVLRPDGMEVLRLEGTQVRNEVLHQLDVSQLPTGVYLAHIKFKRAKIRRSLRFFKK